MKICSGPPYELIPIRKYSTKIRQFGSQLQIAGLLSTCTRMPPPNLPIPMCSLHLANLLPALPSGFAQQLHQQPPPATSKLGAPSNLGTFQSWKPTTYSSFGGAPSEGCKLWLPDCRAQVGKVPRRLERFQGWRFPTLEASKVGDPLGGFPDWRVTVIIKGGEFNFGGFSITH